MLPKGKKLCKRGQQRKDKSTEDSGDLGGNAWRRQVIELSFTHTIRFSFTIHIHIFIYFLFAYHFYKHFNIFSCFHGISMHASIYWTSLDCGAVETCSME